jgi:cytochrome P450
LGEQIRTEAREAAGSDTLEWSDFPELTTAKRVINETLRLRPASWGLLREARSDARLGDVAVRDGDFLMLPQWTLHRDARFFENPETFDPTRWRDRDPNQTQAYFPFGAGPQSCIGGRLATTEATLVLASVFRDYEIETTTEAINNLRVAGVLRPCDGVPATLTSV